MELPPNSTQKKNPRDMVIGVLIAGETVVIFWRSRATEMSPNICQFMMRTHSLVDVSREICGVRFDYDIEVLKSWGCRKAHMLEQGNWWVILANWCLMGDADISAICRDKLYWDILQSLHFGFAGFLSYWTALLLSLIVSDKNISGEVVIGKYVSWTLKYNERCKMDKLAKRVLMCAPIYSVQIWP
jgi:hypothetical protein